MTNPTQSPYGPTDSAATPQQPSPHRAPPLDAAQFYPQDPVPHGYTLVRPASQQLQGNGPGLAALIIGIVSVVLALIPFVGFLAYLLGPAGIILGIVGMVIADRPRRKAGWGLGLSIGSMALAMIMFYVYIYGFSFWATSVGLT
jgi:hypothetical protein